MTKQRATINSVARFNKLHLKDYVIIVRIFLFLRLSNHSDSAMLLARFLFFSPRIKSIKKIPGNFSLPTGNSPGKYSLYPSLLACNAHMGVQIVHSQNLNKIVIGNNNLYWMIHKQFPHKKYCYSKTSQKEKKNYKAKDVPYENTCYKKV